VNFEGLALARVMPLAVAPLGLRHAGVLGWFRFLSTLFERRVERKLHGGVGSGNGEACESSVELCGESVAELPGDADWAAALVGYVVGGAEEEEGGGEAGARFLVFAAEQEDGVSGLSLGDVAFAGG